MLEPGTSVLAFSPGQAAESSHVKNARAEKEDAAPTATSIWASITLVRLQVCTHYGKEDAVPVVIEQKDQRRSGHREERSIGTEEREQAATLLLQEMGHPGPYFSALSTDDV